MRLFGGKPIKAAPSRSKPRFDQFPSAVIVMVNRRGVREPERSRVIAFGTALATRGMRAQPNGKIDAKLVSEMRRLYRQYQ